MESIVSAITKTIPISMFNRGLAGKIFSDVKANGAKVVIKNNAAEAVLLSPDEYIQMMDMINDYLLLTAAADRMSHFDPKKLISEEEMDRRLGIAPADTESRSDTKEAQISPDF